MSLMHQTILPLGRYLANFENLGHKDQGRELIWTGFNPHSIGIFLKIAIKKSIVTQSRSSVRVNRLDAVAKESQEVCLVVLNHEQT
jgi:hypothetical protein